MPLAWVAYAWTAVIIIGCALVLRWLLTIPGDDDDDDQPGGRGGIA